MQTFHLLSRRRFVSATTRTAIGTGLVTLTDIPLVVKKALAQSSLGANGKKLLFVFLRGANDGLNSVIPILDPSYAGSRPDIAIPPDPATDYTRMGACEFPASGTAGTYEAYPYAIRTGNGFTALHPSLKSLAPVHNAVELALIHRVGYPKQSRSHFDSQNYWENGNPNNNLSKDGIFYRTVIESGLAYTSFLTGVSIQYSLPLILRGSKAAMTNLSDPNRYNLLGIPNTSAGNAKAGQALRQAQSYAYPGRKNRELLHLQYQNLSDTLAIFASLDFSDNGNTFTDDAATDNDFPYHLFPTNNQKNGGYSRPGGGTANTKYVVDTSAYGFFERLKAAALVLNWTDAIIAGTEFGGFDTHSRQGGITGQHANLNRRIGWAIYALRKYFARYADKCSWKNLAVVTLSEFGRTTIENSDAGTDHGEAGVMFVAGGSVQGFKRSPAGGLIACHPSDPIPWQTGPTGSMFAAGNRYLKRAFDYRSVLGELIREHLGATQDQLNRIIPGYANSSESLRSGGISVKDNTRILGEVGLL